ncbi:MAG: hypothetical protein J0I47_06215 [Sphingomonas sp.]|uniref:hypothetical protein n=1 Tax=Sphingomonas sp. TaxID=28214 RepID=UPI001AD18206|nr:hypothetical protein [Sphingomonas sp.]MBN8807814.1 hypothetical protein [Sphingomonas sp.]
MAMPTRVVVPIDDSDPQSLKIALGYAQILADNASPKAGKVILLTHTKAQMQSSSLASHLGAQATKALSGGKPVRLNGDLMLQHETMQTLRYGANNAVIVVFYAEDKILDFVDGLAGVAGVVAVPWPLDGAKGWTDRWTPRVHGQPVQAPAPLLTDPVIEQALRSLSRMVNLSHGVMNPRDKQHAEETLRILRAKGHSAPGDRIKSWAVREGWKPGAAEELAKLAGRIFALKTKPSLAAFHEPDARYARWKGGGD